MIFTPLELSKLLQLAERVHTNLTTLQTMAKQPNQDITKAAQLVMTIANMINEYVPIRLRHNFNKSQVSVNDIVKSFGEQPTYLARLLATYKAGIGYPNEIAARIRSRLIGLGILAFSILDSDNLQRALHGDLSRPIIALNGPTAPPEEQQEKPEMKIRSDIKLNQLYADMRLITTNLEALIKETEVAPFNLLEVGLLIGPILDTIAIHVSVPLRISRPNGLVARAWIATAARECLSRTKPLCAALLRLPTDPEALAQFKTDTAKNLAGTFMTMRDIYLSPDVQQALPTNAQRD